MKQRVRMLLTPLVVKWPALLLCFFLPFVCTNCDAKDKKPKRTRYAQIDSIMTSSIGDSISSIIYNANYVVAERMNVNNDTVTVIKSKKLDAEERGVLRFLMASSEKYVGDAVVFGQFSPNIRLTFKVKKTVCIILMDFGLKQSIIKDASGRDVAKFGLTDDGFLKFVNILFPDDKYLSFLLKHQKL